MSDLEGRTALVTGASRGIGKEIARALARSGADVLVSGREESLLAQIAADVRSYGRRAVVIPAELARPGEAEQLARKALGEGAVDILVNNAGVSHPEPSLETSREHWDRTLAINVTAAFFLARELAQGMRERRWGRIINISSQAAHVALEDHAAYCASKGALEMASKVMAVEWASWGITVNCVAPTVIDTPMAREVFATPEAKSKMVSRIPVGRFGTVEEVAAAVLYLVGEGAGMVTGTSLRVDGGWTAL